MGTLNPELRPMIFDGRQPPASFLFEEEVANRRR